MITKNKYIVRTKDKKKYLRINVSNYGSKVSLTTDDDKIEYFSSLEDARKYLEGYLEARTTVSAKDLEIVKVEINIQDKEIISPLPDEILLYNRNYGLERISGEKAKELIKKKFNIDVIDFDLEDRITVITNLVY